MSFFNKKEEVINIELTPHGKKLLSEGKFLPKYYCFFDDDIIYDSECYGVEEPQNNIQTRILEDSIYLKPNSRFSSCSISKPEEYSNYLGIPLVSSDDSIQLAPAYNIIFENSEIESVNFNDQSVYNRYGCNIIPQINLKEKNLKILVKESYSDFDFSSEERYMLGPKLDDSYVTLLIPSIEFTVIEENLETSSDNFEIEVYKIHHDKAERLIFKKDFDAYKNVIVDDILIDKPNFDDPAINSNEKDPNIYEFEQEEKKLVRSYFDIIVDEENVVSDNSADRLYHIYDKLADITPRGDKC